MGQDGGKGRFFRRREKCIDIVDVEKSVFRGRNRRHDAGSGKEYLHIGERCIVDDEHTVHRVGQKGQRTSWRTQLNQPLIEPQLRPRFLESATQIDDGRDDTANIDYPANRNRSARKPRDVDEGKHALHLRDRNAEVPPAGT